MLGLTRFSMSRKNRRDRLALEPLEERSLLSANFLQTNLVADLPGVARVQDPTLIDAWGLAAAATGGPFSVSAAVTGLGETYLGDVNASALQPSFKVVVAGESPTGQVFNADQPFTGPGDFTITDGVHSAPAVFLFATKSGVISGWHPNVGPQIPFNGGTAPAETLTAFEAADGAVYTGLALAKVGTASFLYAADFHNGKIDVLDSQFHKSALAGNFTDPNLPAGFAPFNVQSIGGLLYVTYAKQDAARDGGDVAGLGNGFVDVFETNGQFAGRLISGGDLNSPYGIVQAPPGFGDFGNALLVGNAGDGLIHAFNRVSGQEVGTLLTPSGQPLSILGLRALMFGNGQTAGDTSKLYFTAGPTAGQHGLFGSLAPTTPGVATPAIFALGAAAGGGPEVKVFDTDHQLRFDFFAYDQNFTGGVRVTVGDVNGDGTADLITSPGPGGGPDIRIYDGKTGELLRQFFAFDPNFTGGTYVAAGDVNGDLLADIIIGADQGGGPDVSVFNGADGSRLYSFFPYDPAFTGGVRVGAGDVLGRGYADVLTAAGPGGGPDVTIFDGLTGQRVSSFFAYDPNFTAGVFVASGDVNRDGFADVICGADAGGGPNVTVFSGRDNTLLSSFFAYDPAFTGGVRVAGVKSDGGGAQVVSVAGPGGGPDVRRFQTTADPLQATQVDQFFAFDPRFTGGLYVAGEG